MKHQKVLQFLVFGLISVILFVLIGKQVHAQNLSTFEQGIINEINRARSNPPAYASWIEGVKQTYDPTNQLFQIPGQSNRFPVVGDLKIFDQAISELQKTPPVPTLGLANGLRVATAIHAREQAVATAISQLSPTGKDGSSPTERGNRYGSAKGFVTESIGVGLSPENIVMTLMLDQGSFIRGHRQNLLKPTLRLIGVACLNSSLGGSGGKVCVIDFAQEYSETEVDLLNQQETIQDIPFHNRVFCGFFGGRC